MSKEIEIIAPEGYEAIQTNNGEKQVITFKPIVKKPELPKTWEEAANIAFVGTDNVYREKGYYIEEYSNIVNVGMRKISKTDRNLCTSKEIAEGILALQQLIVIRDVYNDGWKANWKDNLEDKYCIYYNGENLQTSKLVTQREILSFKTIELRNTFLKNFKDLIEMTKVLY